MIDGEIVAFDEDGKPSFNASQNYGSTSRPLAFFVFDLLVLAGKDVMQEPLETRLDLLQKRVLPKLAEPIRYTGELNASLSDLIRGVKASGMEGLVAKRKGSPYEPGRRSGVWMKVRVNQGQKFVIGGYTMGGKTFDALVFGYYDGKELIYVARARNGFTPTLRAVLMKRFKGLETKECPFANLPEARGGRWGQGLTAEGNTA
jgi:bifunctional non-homologous end joining protein LigD